LIDRSKLLSQNRIQKELFISFSLPLDSKLTLKGFELILKFLALRRIQRATSNRAE
jgi:hypothetical protein